MSVLYLATLSLSLSPVEFMANSIVQLCINVKISSLFHS